MRTSWVRLTTMRTSWTIGDDEDIVDEIGDDEGVDEIGDDEGEDETE